MFFQMSQATRPAAGRTRPVASLPLQKTKGVEVSRVSSGRSRLRGHAQSKKGSAVSRGALMGVIFMLPLLWRYWAQVNGEQGWLCTKFRLLFPLSSVVFKHS